MSLVITAQRSVGRANRQYGSEARAKVRLDGSNGSEVGATEFSNFQLQFMQREVTAAGSDYSRSQFLP